MNLLFVALNFLNPSPFAAKLQPGDPLWGNDPEDVRKARQAPPATFFHLKEAQVAIFLLFNFKLLLRFETSDV
jgi:hypothetical protein